MSLPAGEVDAVFTRFADAHRVADLAYGVVADGGLVHAGGAPAGKVFRIASMTKSFTAAAVLGLRDEDLLRLDDFAVSHLPELEGLLYPTADSPAVTLRDLLSMGSGLVSDDPWADRLLDLDDAAFGGLLTMGVGFDRVPGTAYVYSNLGYAILGRVVAKVTGSPLRDWVTERLLGPLGMTATTWDADRVDPSKAATGYRIEGGVARSEPSLGDGAFGAMGGLASTVEDLARWVTFHLEAWPPRDEPDDGPLRRSSLREMARPHTSMTFSDGTPAGYGFGLFTSSRPGVGPVVGHSGGLPGFGSHMEWLPDCGIGIVALANRTYAPVRLAVQEAFEVLAGAGLLLPRVLEPSEALEMAQQDISDLYEQWDAADAARLFLPTFHMDRDDAHRPSDLQALRARWGPCRSVGPITASGTSEGRWRMTCEEGELEVSVTLGPTLPARVMWLDVQPVAP